jgi:hypothetical protein
MSESEQCGRRAEAGGALTPRLKCGCTGNAVNEAFDETRFLKILKARITKDSHRGKCLRGGERGRGEK